MGEIEHKELVPFVLFSFGFVNCLSAFVLRKFKKELVPKRTSSFVRVKLNELVLANELLRPITTVASLYCILDNEGTSERKHIARYTSLPVTSPLDACVVRNFEPKAQNSHTL